jgi:hypothetical protein
MSEKPQVRSSYWLETAPDGRHPALTEDLDVDVAVIGAGIAGLCTAWELTRAGRSVAVLEAGRVAASVTGHTTAKVTALHTLVYDKLRRTRGPEGARLYARSQSEAIERAAGIAEELGIDCDWEARSAYTYARDPGRVDELRAEARAAAEAGLPAAFVEETGLPFPVAGAVRVTGQAQFHPRKYLLALAADLVQHGGRIFEDTTVLGMDEGEPCRLSTTTGATVRARDVVVATHYPIFDRALLFTRLTPKRELVVAGTACSSRPTRTPARCARHRTKGTGVCSSSPVSTSRRARATRGPLSNASPPGPPSTSRTWTSPTGGPRRTTAPPTPCRWSASCTRAPGTPMWPPASAAGA